MRAFFDNVEVFFPLLPLTFDIFSRYDFDIWPCSIIPPLSFSWSILRDCLTPKLGFHKSMKSFTYQNVHDTDRLEPSIISYELARCSWNVYTTGSAMMFASPKGFFAFPLRLPATVAQHLQGWLKLDLNGTGINTDDFPSG